MQIFGSLLLTDGDAELREEAMHSRQLVRLLAYFLFYRDNALPHQKLIEMLDDDGVKNPRNALKNLIYRLRVVMKELGEDDYIRTLPGAYQWNPDIKVITDYGQFEEMATHLKVSGAEMATEDRKRLCLEIIACFRGNVSERIADESWIFSKVTWYQSLFMDTVKCLCEIYEKEEKWNDLEILCNRALSVDSLDEDAHSFLIRALYEQKKYDLAIDHYEKTSNLFFKSMGVRQLEKLNVVFQKIMAGSREDIASIQSVLKESQEDAAPEGVLFCDYRIFRQIYRMELRRSERTRIAEYIMLMTVRRVGGFRRDFHEDKGLMEGVDILERLIKSSLRIGDVAAKYSKSQFVILLPECSYEDAVTVSERIRRRFKRSIGTRQLDVRTELAELTMKEQSPEAREDMEKEQMLTVKDEAVEEHVLVVRQDIVEERDSAAV